MSELILAAIILPIILLSLLAVGVWVGVSLFIAAAAALILFTDAPIGTAMARSAWSASTEWSLAALPLFIWMGEILLRSRLSRDMFESLAAWLMPLPGRLAHVNVLGCGLFAAVCGSSAATAATIGRIAIPELRMRGYSDAINIGSLAGSATLGLLIPPSIVLIVYGAATEQSIARLFVAGIAPGILLVFLFMIYVGLHGWWNPPPAEPPISLGRRIRLLVKLMPIATLIAGIAGAIYSGVASPTDAAAVGVLFALMFAWLGGELNRAVFWESLTNTAATSAMIIFILAGASFLATAMAYTGIPSALADWVSAQNFSPPMLIAALTVLFIGLGCFLDGISVVVLTVAVLMPTVEAAGIDPLWFGIFLVMTVEMAQITPPVGFNLFVLQSVTGRGIGAIALAALPFFLLLLLGVALISVFPQIVVWLPNRM